MYVIWDIDEILSSRNKTMFSRAYSSCQNHIKCQFIISHSFDLGMLFILQPFFTNTMKLCFNFSYNLTTNFSAAKIYPQIQTDSEKQLQSLKSLTSETSNGKQRGGTFSQTVQLTCSLFLSIWSGVLQAMFPYWVLGYYPIIERETNYNVGKLQWWYLSMDNNKNSIWFTWNNSNWS